MFKGGREGGRGRVYLMKEVWWVLYQWWVLLGGKFLVLLVASQFASSLFHIDVDGACKGYFVCVKG
jgi:hypothetical protein